MNDDLESLRAESLRAHDDLRAQQNLHIIQIAKLGQQVSRIEDRQEAAEDRDEKMLSHLEKLLSAYEAGKIWVRVVRYLTRIAWYATIAIGGYALSHWNKVKAFLDVK